MSKFLYFFFGYLSLMNRWGTTDVARYYHNHSGLRNKQMGTQSDNFYLPCSNIPWADSNPPQTPPTTCDRNWAFDVPHLPPLQSHDTWTVANALSPQYDKLDSPELENWKIWIFNYLKKNETSDFRLRHIVR